MNFITMDEYAKTNIKSNPEDKNHDVKESLKAVVERQKDRAGSAARGEPIWVLGAAFSSFDDCFTCITGESDDSDDYEVY